MIKIIDNDYIICDKCGAKMTAKDSGWITIDVNHYCSDCYDFIEIDIPKKGDKQ